MESESSSTSEDSFEINLTYKGQSNFIQVSTTTTALSLHKKTLQQVFGCFTDNNDDEIESEIEIKLLYKGKRISPDPDKYPFADHLLSSTNYNTNSSSSKKKKKNIPKIMIVATNNSIVQELSTKRSDPTIRGFDQEKQAIEKRKLDASQKKPWGEGMTQQHKEYKFCRMKACTWQSFGHRSTEETPHAFHAMQLLEKLATDPGIVAIMKERELVVGTLGELDPIDDRLMKKKEENSGGCVLGYNTNHGLRIDIKLRSNDLSGFRSYPELASTLIHELSHNWVGEHNLLFWSNFAQMRAEYLYTHSQLRNSSIIVHGKKTAELAGLDKEKLENVFDFIMSELVQEMAQHGLHPNMIEGPIRQRIQELEENSKNSSNGHRLGEATYTTDTTASSTRELVLAAAERRAREQQKKEGDER